MRASLTPMQIKVYAFIRQYRAEHGTVPTNQEIATGVETTSANAHRVIKGLTARGYIIPGPPRTWRSYTLVEDHENVNPMMGYILPPPTLSASIAHLWTPLRAGKTQKTWAMTCNKHSRN